MAGIDGYDWSVFGGNPVPGDPDVVRSIGGRLRDLADSVDAQSRLLRAVGADSESVWVGPAANAFRPHLHKLPDQLAKLVASYRDAADGLDGYWPRLQSAQHLAVQAWHKAQVALTEIRVAQARVSSASSAADSAAAAYNHAATAAATGPPDPTGSAAAHVASLQSDYQAASNRLTTANAALAAAQASLKAAHAMADTARSQAQASARQVSATLHQAGNAGIHNPHHSWLSGIVDDVGGVVSSAAHQVEQFGAGLWNGVAQPLTMLAKLADPLTAPEEIRQLAAGISYAIGHPAEFGKALLDWNDLSSGNIARWLGNLTPAVAAAFLTGGAGDVVRGVDGVTALEKAGVTADDVAALAASGDQEAVARIIMRGEDPVPGSVYAGRPPQLGRDLSARDSPEAWFEAKRGDFVGPVEKADPSPERVLSNLHDSTAPLYGDAGGNRSLLWASRPADLLGMDSEREAMDAYALPPDWGARDEVTILHMPGGGPTWDGVAAPQIGADSGVRVAGGGHQVLLHTVSSDSAIWTGPAPWTKVTDPGLAATGAAKLAAGAAIPRLGSGIAPQP